MCNLADPQSPIRKPSLVVRSGKWIGLLLCVALLILFVVSLRVGITWDSDDSLTEISFMAGQIRYGRRADGWETAGKYCRPGPPGWSVAMYGRTYTQPKWQFEIYTSKCWVGYGVPMWIPFVLLAPFTALFWYIDFKRVKVLFCRWVKRRYPILEKRVTVKLVAIVALLHIVIIITTFYCLTRFVLLFFPQLNNQNPNYLYTDLMWAGLVLFLGTPIWALLEAWGYVRFSNWLLAKNPSHCCTKCGYNLTGNMSGRCPECGTHILPQQIEGDRSQESEAL